jgi:hypothetical protein
MKKIVRLTEKDITNMVKRVMNESVIFDELKGYYNRCGSQSPTSTSNRIADEIYDSLTPDSSTFMKIASLGTSTLGTDEVKLIGAFKKLKSFDEFCSTKSSYSRIYNSDMLDDIDGDVDEDEIWKQLSRTVRSLYEKPRTKPVSSVGGGGPKPTTGAGTYRSGSSTPTTGGGLKPTTGGGGSRSNVLKQDLTLGSKGPDVAAIQSKLGLPPDMGIATYGPKTKSAVMEFQKKNKMIATGIVDNVTFSAIMSIGGKKIVKENLSSRTGELYSGINELIDREFDDVEPSEVVRILSNILKHHEGKVYRKKHNINPISKDEVLRNFKRF